MSGRPGAVWHQRLGSAQLLAADRRGPLSVRELGDAWGMTPSGAQDFLRRSVAYGAVVHPPNWSRAWRVVAGVSTRTGHVYVPVRVPLQAPEAACPCTA